MSQQRGSGLSLAEWLVLCLISERPIHGFAIAGLLADDGSLGRTRKDPLGSCSMWPRAVVAMAAT